METIKTINQSIRRPAESISMTGIVIDLDGQIERVFPHKFKMTETKAVVETSLSMSASLPLTLIEQVPKGLYQATDWRDGGARALAGERRALLLPYVYNHR